MHPPLSPRAERFLLVALAAVQLTVVLDFLVIMPLGPQYRHVFHITPAQFNVIVSAYALAAGVSGLFLGMFLDRFDRRKAIFTLFAGFLVGTLTCGLAPSYGMLVAARAGTGLCGGVLGALIYAIVGDAIPEARRGGAMGLVMSAFSVASIAGVPIGLFVAENFSWHVPFFGIVGMGCLVFPFLGWAMPSMRGHMAHAQEHHPLRRWWVVLSHPAHVRAFLFMAVVIFAGFAVYPNISNHMVSNVGLNSRTQLPLVYVCGGICSFFSMNLIGRWSDRIGKPKAFAIVSFCAMVPVLILTRLPSLGVISAHLPQAVRNAAPVAAPLAVVLGASTLLMVCMSGRMGPTMAMMTASVEPRYRGGFMSMSASVQQFASGVAAWVGGQLIVPQDPLRPDGPLTGFDKVGWLSVGCLLVAVGLSMRLRKAKAG